ncbi:Tetratricopeptide repeat protein [uncultured Desulfobacterium sp.]|uniref:Tetratricopeptide repeat protein n=1 Tax=uncultured Desulfobacterium sp. TaxID=201089 RepID=A0A445MUA8_9BACT|nr:Tetratricopeptide repeat protein [uncultured Desulfobacterium sp.]
MFNNIIYFLIVILIFSINQPDKTSKDSLAFFITMSLLLWGSFVLYCRMGFAAIVRGFSSVNTGNISAQYHLLISRLSILAIAMFALDVYLLNLKYWLQLIPGASRLTSLQDVLAVLVFTFYLSTIWFFAYPVYKLMTRHDISRKAYLKSNLTLNLPILFPWLVLSLIYDLTAMISYKGAQDFFNTVEGNLIFFFGFVLLMMVYMPAMIQYWWGCRPLKASDKTRELKFFLDKNGFRYRALLSWPLFEGRMMTAGIMGIAPRHRYILITDSLFEILSVDELKAVVAHEMGHAKYLHLLFYLVFLAGFMVISLGLQDILPYFYYVFPSLTGLISGADTQSTNIYFLAMSIPMLITLVLYFRYVMGFFMRNFERQADLYSARLMGGPGLTVSSLEKIAFYSGKIRDVPSWHHFSIRQRVECLMKTLDDPGLLKRHNRFLGTAFIIYLMCATSLGIIFNSTAVKKSLVYSLTESAIKERLVNDPRNLELYKDLAMVCHELGKYGEAIDAYEKVIEIDPGNAVSLNNLAWILVTAPDKEIRDKVRSLSLAKRAVDIERSSVFLDTLAEAYYANGMQNEAVNTIKEAISVAKENQGYYEKQLKKFLSSDKGEGGLSCY